MAKGLRSALKKEDLRRLYREQKMSLEDIARLYGVSRVAVWKYCRDMRLTRRNRSEARLEAQKRGKVPQNYFEINERFFSAWSPEMAYVLGLLITDGCISKVKNGSYRIRLCLNDKELLEKVAKTMGSSQPITPSKYQAGLYLFLFGRKRIAQDLITLGVVPRKSLVLKFPDVPKVYLREFIRGIFDGDGSVYFDTRSKNCPVRSKFCSGSKDFIHGLEVSLQSLGMPKRNIYEQKTKNGTCYMFRYGHEDSKKLFAALYIGARNELFLERKYSLFRKGFKIASGEDDHNYGKASRSN